MPSLTSQVEILLADLIRQTDDDLRTADRAIPARACFKNVLECFVGIVTKAIHVVYDFENHILIWREGHIENRPRDFITLGIGLFAVRKRLDLAASARICHPL
jgi:hypothetical protein